MVAELRRQLALVAVDEDEVDIRAVIEFASAQFSHPDDGKLARRRAPALAQFGIPMLEDGR